MNCVTDIATNNGRDYVKPEDIETAFRTFPEDKVRMDALEVMACQTGFLTEDYSYCAFVTWRGKQ